MTAAATPGGRPLFLAALERPPLASAGAARHAKTGLLSVQLSQAPVQNLRFTTNRDHRSRGPAAPHRPAPVPLGTRKLELASTTTAVRLTRKTTLPHGHFPGARDLERTALRPRRPPLRRAGAPKGRLIGHPGEKNGQRQPQQNALWGGRPRGFHLDCAHAQRLKSLFMLADDRRRSATS